MTYFKKERLYSWDLKQANLKLFSHYASHVHMRPLKKKLSDHKVVTEEKKKKKKPCKIGFGPALTSAPLCVVCVLGARRLI